MRKVLSSVAMILALSSLFLPGVYAQTGQSVAELGQKGAELISRQRFTEALPIYERLVVLEPSNPDFHFNLGFSLLGQMNATRDAAQRKVFRLRARAAFVKSKELGVKQSIVDGLIDNIPVDGSETGSFSSNSSAQETMMEAEAYFAKGQLDDAFKAYQKALLVDPKLYEAALYSGDVLVQQGKFPDAEIWYQKAIAIDPFRETAYRYSATPLMRQGKTDLARDRYIEAFITEPANKLAIGGFIEWGKIAKVNLAHPNIKVPDDVAFDQNGKRLKDQISVALLTSQDGSAAWAAYATVRTLWQKEKFAKAFPNEKQYRHTLMEEAEALRAVVKGLAEAKAPLSPQLQKLKKLESDGLLEPFIMMAMLDNGIYGDYRGYLTDHRDKLRKYVVEYVVTGGGR